MKNLEVRKLNQINNALDYHREIFLMETAQCPNGADRCTGLEHCPYNTSSYPSDYVMCDVKKYRSGAG